MLSFNTCFPVAPDATINELLLIGKEWRLGSPHSRLSSEIEANFCLESGCSISNEFEELEIQKHAFDGIEIGGIRHTDKTHENITWITEIVGARFNDSFWVAVRSFAESQLPLYDVPKSKKPHIVKLILKKIGIGFDGNIPVADEPIFLKESDVNIAQMAIEDKLGCVMPTVYISICNNGKHNINYKKVARNLSGMAHVIVEPSVDFSYKLKKTVNEINAYNGAVGVYFPGGSSRLFFVQRGRFTSPLKIEQSVCEIVRNALLTQKGVKECTWLYIQEVKSRIKINELKQQESTEIEEYIATFDEENRAVKKQLEAAEKEISRLNSKLYSNTMSSPVHGTPLLVRGEEDDKYEGETIDIILDILRSIKDNYSKGTRRHDIIEDIILHNSVNGQRATITSQIKQLFKDYTKLDPRTRASLGQLGFAIYDDGKHYKLTFTGDSRYSVILPKTPSCCRSGKNTASDLIKQMF